MNADAPQRHNARCPICSNPETHHPLVLADRFENEQPSTTVPTQGGPIEFAVLRCSNPECAAEYPVVDGVPIVRSDAREFLAANQAPLHRRDDLPGELSRVLADTIDPGSQDDLDRYYLSVYARDAFPSDGSTSGIVSLLDATIGLLDRPLNQEGPVLDLGCGVGRTCFELAAKGMSSVVGMDLNLTLLRCAAGVRRDGAARFAIRRNGVRYDPIEIPFDPPNRQRVELWCGDALDPPFARGRFETIVALNILDCVASPVLFLQRAAEMLRPGGRLLLTTPYDWTAGVTPMEGWIGGHSPRSELAGDPARTLRSLLDAESTGQKIPGLRLTAETDGLEWVTHLHDRASLHYRAHAVVAERVD